MSEPDLQTRARDWLADDPDPETRHELADLLERGDVVELADRFAGLLSFGTAGLRGAVGAGPNRMNVAVVIRAAAAIAAWVRDGDSLGSAQPPLLRVDLFLLAIALYFYHTTVTPRSPSPAAIRSPTPPGALIRSGTGVPATITSTPPSTATSVRHFTLWPPPSEIAPALCPPDTPIT